MDKRTEQLEHLTEIRAMMERSSRFISLSGFAGIAAGIIALIGVAVTYLYLGSKPFEANYLEHFNNPAFTNWGIKIMPFFVINAAIVFILSSIIGVYFTSRSARRKGQKIWVATSKRMIVNGVIPMLAGGLFCLALMIRGSFDLVLPTSMIFYGLACINGSKYTLNDILYMGVFMLCLGSVALFITEYGIEFWAFGFGILHIVYGAIMYNKYESKAAQ